MCVIHINLTDVEDSQSCWQQYFCFLVRMQTW